MTQVLINFDSETKNVTITMDGEPLENVNNVSYYTYKDCCYERTEIKHCISLSIRETGNGVSQTKHMTWDWSDDISSSASFNEEVEEDKTIAQKLFSVAGIKNDD